MPDRSSKRPWDANQLAHLTVALATGDVDDPILTLEGKNAAAVILGRRGGLKGGLARALSLSEARRSEIAKKAASARWSKKGEPSK